MTVVRSQTALVDVGAICAAITGRAVAAVRSIVVNAGGVCVAFVISQTAFVDVGTNEACADISGFTLAQVTTVSVGACSFSIAVVVTGAFVVVGTVGAVATKTRHAAAAVGPVASHGAVGIGVTGVVTLVKAKIPISTGEVGLYCVEGSVVVVARKYVIRRVAVVYGSDRTVSVDACGFVYR